MSKTDYEHYLNTEVLLSLQKPASKQVCHDELQFQIIHQVEELWMKLALHEFAQIKTYLKEARLTQAHVLFQRTHLILSMMSEQMRLLNTMSPTEYHKVRTQLGKGSGQESPGFNMMLKDAPTLWPLFEAQMKKRDITLLQLHENPDRHPDLFLIAEDMFTVDEYFLNFRYLHLQLVKRIIGGDVPSLKGVHAEKYLTHGLHSTFYPPLWAIRNEISLGQGIPIGAKSGLCPYPHSDKS